LTISAGTRLGPYEIIAPIGAGGMGEVWKARDTRLDRSVAIKILPSEFAHDAQFKLRFEREAKTISQLTHPHICTLYDVGNENGVEYLVMELLDGESLADRLTKGPLPIEQVLRYGIEIAEALEKAHRAGVVHRDLKPGNVMITKSGAKLLDFGLAKATVPLASISTATVMPTEHKPLTQEGTIIGTFRYMAPEQVEGREADCRTDIFALGALLYEMATGKRAFDGKSRASLIASILEREPPPISAVQPVAPRALERVVQTCLRKDPDERWQSAHDVATALRWTDEAAPPSARNRKANVIAWAVAAIAAVAAFASLAFYWRDRTATRNAAPVRTVIVAPEKTSFAFGASGAPPVISPDGTKIVFGAAENGKPQSLWIRSIDALEPRRLAGTEGGMCPFWSPDGRSIGFFDATSLKKMDISGGGPVALCDVADARGGSWSGDGRTIIFASHFSPISRISASGGTAVEVTKLSSTTSTHRWPEFLPDSKHFLFLAAVVGVEDPLNAIAIGNIDGGPWKAIITDANEPHYACGAILFTHRGTLTAQAFDAKTLTLRGDPVPLKEQHIESLAVYSRSVVSVSANGETLLYQIGTGSTSTQLLWIDRSGKPVGAVGDPAPYRSLALAPDGKKVLATIGAAMPANLWLFDVERNVKTRVTFTDSIDLSPVWSPDGMRMIYTTARVRGAPLMLHDLATAHEEVLLQASRGASPFAASWSAGSQQILYAMNAPNTRGDIYSMSFADRKPHVYLSTPFNEVVPRFSPDGKWVAYQSQQSGTWEVYLAPFPATGAKWQVSNDGGMVPRWRGDGRELYYVNGDKLIAVPISLDATPQIGRPVELFAYRFAYRVGETGGGMYDVAADGQRFLMNARYGDDVPVNQFVLMQHFDNELREALGR
jgi:Tol biopolymer transport system component